MNVVIVYDSVFGNTKKIAEAIGSAIGESAEILNVNQFKIDNLKAIDLLFVGSPTRAFKPTKNIANFIKIIKKKKPQLKVACFDTRIHVSDKDPWILRKLEKRFGYATDSMIKALSNSAKITLYDPNWFFVGGTEGPLSNEELDKAAKWANQILQKL